MALLIRAGTNFMSISCHGEVEVPFEMEGQSVNQSNHFEHQEWGPHYWICNSWSINSRSHISFVMCTTKFTECWLDASAWWDPPKPWIPLTKPATSETKKHTSSTYLRFKFTWEIMRSSLKSSTLKTSYVYNMGCMVHLFHIFLGG